MKTSPRQLLAFLLIVIFLLTLRLGSYEPAYRSVSNFDTQEFISAAKLPFFSARFFTSGRPTTMAFLYKALAPDQGYQVTNLSSPGDFINPPLAYQPGLGAISNVQTALSIAAWLGLAWVLFRNLRHQLPRLLGPFLVLFFGFTPQLAEWDYIAMSESVSVSVFILLLALSVELSAHLGRQGSAPVRLWVGWFVTATLAVFARDSSAYFLLVLLAAFFILLLGRRRIFPKLQPRALWIALAALAILFFIQNQTAQASVRWVNPFFNNLLAHVFPDPEHLAFFKERGLPVTEEVLALQDSSFTQLKFFEIPYLVEWTRQHGASAYVSFIVTHPDWAWQTFVEGTRVSFTENIQPFFTRNEDVTPTWLVYLGDLLHPKDVSVLAVVSAELSLLAYLAWRSRGSSLSAIAACLIIFFIGELAMLFVSILGDASSIVRHTVGSLIPLRLSVWLLLVFIFDAALLSPSQVRRANQASERD